MFNTNNFSINIPATEELQMIYIVTIVIGLVLAGIGLALRPYFKKRKKPTKGSTIVMCSGLAVTLFQGMQLLSTVM